MHTLLRAYVIACGCFFGLILGVHAQPGVAVYPSKPIRFVVPFAPGGATDVVARLIGQKLTEQLKQPIVIDNRPGAGGNIGAAAVAKEDPDGYTMFMGTISTHAINQSLYKSLPFHPIKDFVPVVPLTSIPLVLVVTPSLPVKTVADLIALTKARPGGLTYASPGSGTALHLAGELFKDRTGIDMLHVPYKGSTPALTDVMAGRVSVMFDTTISALTHVKAGKLRALAVTTRERIASLPDLPTIAEAALPGFEISAWNGIFFPAGTPKPIIERINTEVEQAMAMEDVRKRLTDLGAVPLRASPEEFATFQKAETEKYSKLIKKTGIHIE